MQSQSQTRLTNRTEKLAFVSISLPLSLSVCVCVSLSHTHIHTHTIPLYFSISPYQNGSAKGKRQVDFWVWKLGKPARGFYF